MPDRVALITGVTGQDGSYASDLLRGNGYRIVGTTRSRPEAVPPDVELIEWDVRDGTVIADVIADTRPSEIYNFAAYSTGSGMFADPAGIGEVNGLAVTHILDAIRRIDPAIRFAQASSSEMFGGTAESPQSETTPFAPRSPYAAAKIYAHNMIDVYRRHHGLFACSAILFNHESPRRGTAFVTRKVAAAAAAASLGQLRDLPLGNLEARRDWGFAGDYVRAMRLMLRAAIPADYVVATGETRSVRDLCDAAFGHVGLDYRDYVTGDAALLRPTETKELTGNAGKARRDLGWHPQVSFGEMIAMMVDAELERRRRG